MAGILLGGGAPYQRRRGRRLGERLTDAVARLRLVEVPVQAAHQLGAVLVAEVLDGPSARRWREVFLRMFPRKSELALQTQI
jgi:hypothetical protein